MAPAKVRREGSWPGLVERDGEEFEGLVEAGRRFFFPGPLARG